MRLDSLTPEGWVLVGRIGEASQPALLAIGCSHRALLDAIRDRRDVLVDFIDGDLEQPVVLGILRERLNVETRSGDAIEPVLELRASEQIAITCGESELRLEKDGRVSIRGTDVDSASTGALRLRGARVGIN